MTGSDRQTVRAPSIRALGAFGVLSAAFFLAADVVGASLTPNYSMRSDAISELVEKGAPAKAEVDLLLLAYHALVIPFALGLRAWLGAWGVRLGPGLIGLAGAAGVVLTLFFPCDPGCEPFVTLSGTLHIFIAVPMGFAILAGLALIGLGLRRRDRMARFAIYTTVTAITGLFLAVTTVAFAETDLVGVLERLLTFGYLQWYVFTGAWLASGRAPAA